MKMAGRMGKAGRRMQMKAKEWTPPQLEAIEARGRNILVSAGAGSGKTAVLIERIIRRLRDEKNPLNIDQLLIVTFTNAAAEEMRERLGRALNTLARENKEDKALLRQLALLPQAAITTLHSFCLDLIRRYFYHLGLDGKARVGGETELLILEDEVLKKYLEDEYERGNLILPQLGDAYGGNKDDAGLLTLIKDLYKYSRSQPDPKGWLRGAAGDFDNECLEDYSWCDFLAGQIRADIEELRLNFIKALEIAAIPESWLTITANESRALAGLSGKKRDLSRLLTAMGEIDFRKLPSGEEGHKENKKAFQKLRDDGKKAYLALKNYFCIRPPEVLLEDLKALSPLMHGLCDLVEGYSEALSREKRRRNLIDFGDMEHFCLALLEDETLALNKELKKQYREILVDEYQDINGVQERILNLLSSGDNFFAVGDIKQSIYRFRLAEPELFLGKYEAYGQKSGGQRVDLNSNFRSSRQIIAGINFVFKKILSPQSGEINYDDEAALKPGLEFEGLPTEILFLNRKPLPGEEKLKLSAWQEECILLCKKIIRLREEGYALKDMAVLIRSPKNKEGLLLEELRQNGIEAIAAGSGNSLKSPEFALPLAVLKIIDNPRQDIPLAAVLLSPISNFSPDELLTLRLNNPGCLYDALIAEAAKGGKFKGFLNLLNSWQKAARNLRVSQLIWQIYQETALYYLGGALPDGCRRQSNLKSLYNLALEYEANSSGGLFRFIRYLEELEEGDYSPPSGRLPGEGEDALTIMSIHKSKGLEYPVVFLAGLNSRFEFRDLNRDLLIHKNLGWGPKIAHRGKRLKFPSLAYEAIGRCLHKETIAEEMRILYVAMTRARERLIITAAVNDLEKAAERWLESANYPLALPASQLLKDKSPLDWLGRALICHPDGEKLRSLLGAEYIGGKIPEKSRFNISICPRETKAKESSPFISEGLNLIAQGLELPESPHKEEVNRVLDYKYPGQESCNFASKWTITQVLKALSPQEREERASLESAALNGENFAEGALGGEKTGILLKKEEPPKKAKAKINAAQRGSALHLLMEKLDIKKIALGETIGEQIERLLKEGYIPPELAESAEIKEGKLIDILEAFYSSPLGQRLLKADFVERERHFTYLIPASCLKEGFPREEIILQGMVDLAFGESDGWVLVDYKSGGLYLDNAELLKLYGRQISLYAAALTDIWPKPVKEAYLYMLEDGRIIPVPLGIN